MSLLSRHTRLLATFLVLFALSTFPMFGSSPHEIDWLSATPAWAGGSPDETLNPTPTPPRASYAPTVESDGKAGWSAGSASPGATRMTSRAVLSWKERIGIAFRIYLAYKLRF